MNQVGRNTLAGETLRNFVERIENEEAQKKQHSDNIAAICAEAKAQGFLPAAVRWVVKQRKLKPSERQESETLRDLYMHAMGMASEPPLFRAVGLMSVDIAVKEAVIEAAKALVPANGSITIEAGGSPVRLSRDKDGNVAVTEVVEKPVEPVAADGRKKPTAPKESVPVVSADEAESLGRIARRADVPIIQNPFPYGHPNRPHWDRGWRVEDGGDGMGPSED
ncbi:MAG: DUF2312 domain-containing protein [Rhodovulum sp.]|nr:DUF2312 domain-containing protein [Rhodovulum sp.]